MCHKGKLNLLRVGKGSINIFLDQDGQLWLFSMRLVLFCHVEFISSQSLVPDELTTMVLENRGEKRKFDQGLFIIKYQSINK